MVIEQLAFNISMGTSIIFAFMVTKDYLGDHFEFMRF